MPEQSLTALLEALILAAARPVSVRELAAASELSEADTELAITELRRRKSQLSRHSTSGSSRGLQFFTRSGTNPMYSVYSTTEKSRV